jgi:hypothetical protein
MAVGVHSVRERKGLHHDKTGHVKLLSPPGQVLEELNLTGFGSLFEVFTDLTRAVDSFRQRAPEMENR